MIEKHILTLKRFYTIFQRNISIFILLTNVYEYSFTFP